VGGSDHAYVLRFFTFATRADVELDALTLIEGPVPTALDVRVVDEHIFALFTGYESVALLSVEELHGACCQLSSLFTDGLVPLTDLFIGSAA